MVECLYKCGVALVAVVLDHIMHSFHFEKGLEGVLCAYSFCIGKLTRIVETF